MKLFIMTLLIPLVSSAEGLVTCQLQNFSDCNDCKTRIPVSCEDHAFNGSLELKVKPQKIQWLISNPKIGTERIVTTDNSKANLNDLKNQKDLKAYLQKLKITVSSDEKVSLIAVQLAPKTALYKKQQGTEVASMMTPSQNTRNIASSPSGINVGGAARAQKLNGKK